jgi:hypothetical protein
MNDNDRTQSRWLSLAGAYAGLLAGLTLLGTIISLGGEESYPGNAVRMPAVAVLIALAVGGAAVGMFQRANWGRLMFLAVAPWGAIALGSAFARSLWREDVPYTALTIFAYVPLAFLLSRGTTLRAVGATSGGWVKRGGALVLVCAAAMFLARLAVVASKPSGGGGFFGTMVALNDYVKRLVLCDVPLWNYVIAFIAVSIPTRFQAREDAQQVAAPNGGPAASVGSSNAPGGPRSVS